MALPLIKIPLQNTIHGINEEGDLLYKYSPLQNLKTNSDIDLSPLRINAKLANIDINKPIQLETEVSFDDSVNLLINDATNPIKIVNSRFYLKDSSKFKIADRKGNLDTNIYIAEDFKIETGLIKTVRNIITLDFLGIYDGGNLPVGNYTFYFKLADSDGNESDFISESGKVVCHIGSVNQPSSIRGGLLNENSNKSVKFRLNNLDLAYDYINIYYTKNSGDELSPNNLSFKILDKFKILNVNTEISITGYENTEAIDNSEINTQYASFESSQTITNCQNITFAGNITKNYELFKTLEKYSLFVTPQVLSESERLKIGNLDHKYIENYLSSTEGNEYYNSSNIYYKLGYWEDIYRFGIVYILNDYTLSPVFNIRGIDVLEENNTQFYEYDLEDEFSYSENFLLFKTIEGSLKRENIKGVFRIKNNSAIFNVANPIKPLGLKINFTGDVVDGKIEGGIKLIDGLKDLTKGFFIVRQNRIPSLLTQALAIGTAEKSYTPVLKATFTDGDKYFSESFLKKTIKEYPLLGRSIFNIDDELVNNNALICPEASLRPYIYNNLFNSSEFTLQKYNHYSPNKLFTDYSSSGDSTLYSLGDLSFPSTTSLPLRSNLLLVEPGIELINNVTKKFSSKAGNAIEAWKHLDPVNGDLEDVRETTTITDKEWSDSVSKIRGEFSTYIGCDINNLEFGQHYNIYQLTQW